MTQVFGADDICKSTRLPRVKTHASRRVGAPRANVIGRLAIFVGLVTSGCSAPKIDYGNCVATCRTDGDCANGMRCTSGFCVKPGWEGSCTAGDAGTGGSATASLSAGGTGASVYIMNRSGGTSSTAGTIAVSGGGSVLGTGSTGAPTAAGGITSGGSAPLAGGVTANGGVTVSGDSTHSASTMSTGGAAVGGTGGSNAGVGGITGGHATDAGGSGTTGPVVPTGGTSGTGGTGGHPDTGCTDAGAITIVTQSLSDGCQGEVYSAQLQATAGVDAGATDEEWSATPPDGLGLTLSKDGKLSGTLAKTGEFPFDVTVTSRTSSCTATQRLTLTVNGESTTACPTIKVKGKTSSALAPASCVAWPYAADFDVSGGTSPYTWAALEFPPGITFDSTSQHASGMPTDTGDLVLQVTDKTGRVVQRSFAVPLRNKCWFAYISSESGAQRLHLFDPLLGTRLQRPTSNNADITVTDYKFSPDGKYIAYRVKDGSGNSTLSLWQAPEWDHEQQLDLGGSITEYSWSNNGKVLAAAIDNGTETRLGGVSVAGVLDDQLDAGMIQGLYELQPVAAPVGLSEITWYGNDGYVAFKAPLYPNYPPILTEAIYSTSGFQLQHSGGLAYDPSVVLYPSSVGFYAMVPATGKLHFYAVDSAVPIFHGNVAIAPDGTHVGLSVEGKLSLYSAANSTDPPPDAATLASQGCTNILGWAAKQGRIICVDDAVAVRLHSFDFVHGTVASTEILGSEPYIGATWQGHRRLISPTGNCAAFTTANSVYLANLGLSPPTVAWTAQLRDTQSPAMISFSPNEQLLVVQDGSTIRVFATDSPGFSVDVAAVAGPAEACQEQILAAPDWCGMPGTITQPVWSSDSQLIGLVREDGQLVTVDLRDPSATETIRATSNCGTYCIDTGRFQP